MAGFESFNEITCDRDLNWTDLNDHEDEGGLGENETKNPCQLREMERFLVIVNFSTLPSSFPLSSFCRFSLSAATTFHPFFVPRTLNRRISCSLPSYSAPVAAAAAAALAAAVVTTGRKIGNFELLSLLFLPSLILESFLQNRVYVRVAFASHRMI